MNIHELDSYNLGDAVKFNSNLNPRLWDKQENMRPEVRDRLLEIAADFKEFLGVSDFELKDITVSGSNAAYTYTPHSDIDLHLLVDLPEADRNKVYRELFDAKKYQYNDQHNIKIGGYDVELYVQNANNPVVSQGEYSLLNNQWINVPKRVRANIDDRSTKSKYEDLKNRIEQSIKSKEFDRMANLMTKIKEMRKTGLAQHGEFGPENLAFKMLRSQGWIGKLVDARNAARDQELSLDEKAAPAIKYGFKSHNITESATDLMLRKFADSCIKFLKIKNVPSLEIKNTPEWSKENASFGRYDQDTNTLTISVPGRHILDILRTMAHELTHCRQAELEELPADAGETGSPWEDQANAMAGRIMRNWAAKHPDHFAQEQLDEGIISRAAAMAAVATAMAMQPAKAVPQAPNQQPAQVQKSQASTVLDLARVIYNAKNITRAGAQEELTQELKNIIRAQGGDPGAANQSRVIQMQRQQQNESSGYIPTKAQSKDPRFKTALTVDVHPGQIGKEANKLRLQTDAQGHPALLINSLANQLREFKETGQLAAEGQDKYGNFDPPGPESPPEMPAGTIKVDVSDMYDWYKIGQKISNLKSIDKTTIGKGPPSTVLAFGSEELENMYSHDLNRLGLPTHDLDEPGEEDIDEGTLSVDVPNEEWLQDKIDYAKSKGRNRYGVPFMGSTTASVVGTPPRVRVMRLASLPGQKNEQTNVRKNDLKWLMDYMERTGKLPPMGSNPNEEYLPYIEVAYNGEAWVNEGNHRIMAAYRLNWPDMPIEIRYFDGGERITTGPMYPGKIGLGEVAVPKSESVTEIFEPGKQNWKWRRQSSDEAFASFVVGDREYQWHAFNSDANPTKWEIQFRLMRVPADPDGLDLFGQTGTGNSAEVLSTAVDITRAFLQTYGLDKVEEITFNAKEDSRIDLYAKMIRRLLPNWELSSRKSLSHGMQFTLTDPRAYDKPENKITEAFDQPYRLRWEKSGKDITATTKLDDGGHLGVMFQKGYNQDKEEAWSVEFYRNNSQEVTGEGDAQRVFSTVLTSIQAFIKKYKPNKVIFAANKIDDTGHESQSRARLYDSLVQRYAKAWGFRAFRADTGNKVIYELSRLKQEVGENTNQAAVNALQKKHGWSTGRNSNALYFTWQGLTYEFYGERMRINFPNTERSISVVWGKKPDWQGRGNDELSFAQAVQQKYLKFDLAIWQALDRGQITDSQALQKFKAENERQAREAIAQGVTEGQEKFNRAVMQPGFEFSQEINGVTYEVTNDEGLGPVVTVTDKNKEVIAQAAFWKHKTRPGLESLNTYVEPEWQGQGIAANMYAVMRMLGANISPSTTQTNQGQEMWAKWNKQGDAKHIKTLNARIKEQGVAEAQEQCPKCGGAMFSELLINEKQDACYYKVKSRYKVWPSAYASGALVQCRKKGAANWGNKK